MVEKENDTNSPSNYQAYLLRCWRENNAWRFSLESISDERQQRGYRSLEDLFTAVAKNLNSAPPTSEQTNR